MTDAPAEFPWTQFMANIESLVEECGGAEQFCVDTGVAFWTLRAWREGRNQQPKYLTLSAIADHFDMTVDDLTSKRLPRR